MHLDEVDVAHVFRPVAEGPFLGLGEQVHLGRRAWPHGGHVEGLDHFQDLGDDDAPGTGGRHGGDVVAAVAGAQRLTFSGLVARQILQRDATAMGCHGGGDHLRRAPGIEIHGVVLDTVEGGTRSFCLNSCPTS